MHLYRSLEGNGLMRKDSDGQGGTVEFPMNQQPIADTVEAVAGGNYQQNFQAPAAIKHA